MALIKDNEWVDDVWRTVADGEALPADGPVLVSLARWRADRAALLARRGAVGLRLRSDESIEDLADDLARFEVIALEFARFTDGRPFSTARLLRERYRFRGELRAVGHVLRDQFLFLIRCGFNAVEVDGRASLDAWLQALAEVDVFYQPASDRRVPVPTLRQRRAGPTAAAGAARGELEAAGERAACLRERCGDLDGADLLRVAIREAFPGRIAVVSSFGVESAVLLALVAEVDPATPVIFLDTGKHFEETLAYRDELVRRLGLRRVESVRPDVLDLAARDPDGTLWRSNPDLCCHLRKVLPLERALAGYDAWVTGRKRYQGFERAELPLIEAVDGKVKINPLAGWSAERVREEMRRRGLPPHPLREAGYLSVGCAPCTEISEGADPRGGRWAWTEKRECGIHTAKWAAQ